MKTIFLGSSFYCLPIAKSLHDRNILNAIVTKPHGEVALFAQKTNSKTFYVTNKKELDDIKDSIKSVNPDLAVVADFGLILPKNIFSIPKYGTLNIHFSLLPKLRGASPVQQAILDGAKKTGITIIKMDEGLDTGDIVWQKEYEIKDDETTESLYKRLFEIAAKEIPQIIDDYVKGKIVPFKQDNSKATLTKILTREDGFIHWKDIEEVEKSNDAQKILRKYFAFTPWPGIWTKLNIKGQSKRLKILNMKKENGKAKILIVQLEGKNPVTWKQFLDAYSKEITQ